MAKYVPGALRERAERLYGMAERVALLYAAVGAALGFVCAMVAMAAFVWLDNLDPAIGKPNRPELVIVGLVGAALGGLCGWLLGAVQAERLRLEAETALCQAQVEENTRTAVSASRGAAGSMASRG